MDARPPPIFPNGVLAVERMTVFDICAFRPRRRPAGCFLCLAAVFVAAVHVGG
jgi:hypothetical protein